MLALLGVGGGAFAATPIEDLFDETKQSYEASSADEKAVLSVLHDKLKAGFERFDLALLDSVLTPDFERLLVASPKSGYVESRENFISARSAWKNATPKTQRRFSYVVQNMAAKDGGKTMDVVALSQWKSKYFHPRFLETLTFRNNANQWRLARQVLVPLHPSKPKMHEVELVLATGRSGEGEFIEEFARTAVSEGPDAALDRLPRMKSNDASGYVTYVAVFREPPPVGSKVKLVYEVKKSRCRGKFPTEFKIDAVSPYSVYSGWGHWQGCKQIKVRAYLNGKEVAKEQMNVR